MPSNRRNNTSSFLQNCPIAAEEVSQMHCPAQETKFVSRLLLAFCLSFITFTLLQVYDGFLATLVIRARPQLLRFQPTNTPQLKSRPTQYKHANSISTLSGSRSAAPAPQARSLATTISTVGKKPLIVYRGDNGQIRACVIPRVCSAEPVISGITNIGKATFFIPEEYRRSEKTISQCISRWNDSNFEYYRGDSPTNDTTYYNIDVLGRSCTARWHSHFAHFIFHFSKHVLTITSLFRSEGKSTLPRPQCIYPSNTTKGSSPCRNGDLESLRPQLLISHVVLKHGWTRRFLQFLGRGIGAGLRTKQPMLHITKWSGRTEDMGEQRMECYRSLVTTPENYDTEKPGHDSLMKAAGIQREPKCDGKPHIVLLSRRYGPGPGYLGRKILNSTLNELQSELATISDASVEWIYGLGGLNFSEQVKLIQRADVLVTVHGAELSNAVFLRRGARLIELFPFGFHMNYYKHTVADPIHVKHIAYAGKPDPDPFYKCIKSAANKDPLGEARAMYKKHLILHRNAKTESERQKAGLFFTGFGPRESCMKSQLVDFNPHALAEIISREASTRCAHVP